MTEKRPGACNVHAICMQVECPSEADIAHSQPEIRTPVAAEAPASQPGLRKHEITADRFESAPGLTDRSFALAPASGKPKGENYRTDCNQQFSHGVSPPKQLGQVSSSFLGL